MPASRASSRTMVVDMMAPPSASGNGLPLVLEVLSVGSCIICDRDRNSIVLLPMLGSIGSGPQISGAIELVEICLRSCTCLIGFWIFFLLLHTCLPHQTAFETQVLSPFGETQLVVTLFCSTNIFSGFGGDIK